MNAYSSKGPARAENTRLEQTVPNAISKAERVVGHVTGLIRTADSFTPLLPPLSPSHHHQPKGPNLRWIRHGYLEMT